VENNVKRVRVAIDPQLSARHGPEIHWTWRLLLSGIGWAWEVVSPAEVCDIAYVLESAHAPAARLCVRANPEVWAQPSVYCLNRVEQRELLSYPVFRGESVAGYPIHIDHGRVLCERDVIFDVFWLVTGQAETHWPYDRHGFYDLRETTTLAAQLPTRALASQIGAWLEQTLLTLGCPQPVPRWPHGKRAAIATGHDVDYPEVIRWLEPLRIVLRQGLRGARPALDVLSGRRSHWQFSSWLALERQFGIRSAFYFVARQGSLWEYATGIPDTFYDITQPHFRALFDMLNAAGCEIGLHASYLAYQSQETFAAEKQKLEAACGQPVSGNRHHYWHMPPPTVEDTLLLHEQVGLRYDSSLNHDRYLGWRRGLAQPFFPFHQKQRRELQTLQVSVGWMDSQRLNYRTPPSAAQVNQLRNLIDHVADVGGSFVIDIHDYVFDDALFPGWSDTYRQLLAHAHARGDFWFATPAQLATHWLTRHHELRQASLGLN
jgi:hypothetical protein